MPCRMFLLLAAALLLSLLTPKAQAQAEFRGLWVDAWGNGFLTASQVTTLVNHCRTYNFNAVVVQMRRRGDAFYMPGITDNDPRTTAISSGYDALAELISKCHSGSPRIEVHCWVTTQLIWSSTTPPSQPGHVFNTHPEFLTENRSGTQYIGEGYYLDPGHPGATLWNYRMATNIVHRYAIDGFHWDYIRYPAPDAGYNPTAIARYNSEFGATGKPLTTDSRFSTWRRRQVTDFLRWSSADLLTMRTNLVISTAVFGSRSDAFDNRFQDWAAWNNEGILDICMPMGYTDDNSLFTSRINDSFANQGVRRIYQGQGAYLNTKENTLWQLNAIRNKGFFGSMFYSYRVPNSGTVNQTSTFTHIRDNYQPTWVSTPVIPWKATPTKGIIKGKVTRQGSGDPVYNATITLNSNPIRTVLTDPHGNYAFFETVPASYTLTASGSGLPTANTNATIAAGQIIRRDFVLSTNDNVAPVLSGIRVILRTDHSAVIEWNTDENADSKVNYGLTTSYGSTVTETNLVTRHSIRLSGLAANTQYHFRVRSRDVSNNEAVSGNFTFSTHSLGSADDVVVESRLSNGDLNEHPPYVESGFSDSTLKSSAAGLTGQGSRYAVSGTPTFTVTPTLPVAGGTYQVYMTHGVAASISDDLIVSVQQTKSTGLPATTTIFQEPGGNTWEFLGTMKLNNTQTTPALTFTYSGGSLVTGSRMYSDSTKFVYLSPPIITQQPQGAEVPVGSTVAFGVSNVGAIPFSYQWRRNGTNLAGSTGTALSLTNVNANASGNYSVVITNIAGAVTSQTAVLTVTTPPAPLISASVHSGQQIRLVFSAQNGQTYKIQTSTDLATWTTITNIVPQTGTVEFIDPITNAPQVYYRVRWDP